MTVDRPVRLTFPAREPGARRIMAGGVQVGHVLANWHMDWTAYLWMVAGKPGEGFAVSLTRGNLVSVREAAMKRLADEGPWWR